MRVPVVPGGLAQAGAGDALLYEGDGLDWDGAFACFQPAATHPAGCACCAARAPAAQALTALLHARARGQMPFFTRVVAVLHSEAGRRELDAALATDAVVSACFKAAAAHNLRSPVA